MKGKRAPPHGLGETSEQKPPGALASRIRQLAGVWAAGGSGPQLACLWDSARAQVPSKVRGTRDTKCTLPARCGAVAWVPRGMRAGPQDTSGTGRPGRPLSHQSPGAEGSSVIGWPARPALCVPCGQEPCDWRQAGRLPVEEFALLFLVGDEFAACA